MKTYVIDASIIVKWIFPESSNEVHIPQALDLLRTIRANAVNVLQPPHWLAEVASVIVRLKPKVYEDAINLLFAMKFKINDDIEIFHIASRLSHKYKHHLFDSLYHAVALHHGNAKFITADNHYLHKVSKEGAIMRLSDFSIFDD